MTKQKSSWYYNYHLSSFVVANDDLTMLILAEDECHYETSKYDLFRRESSSSTVNDARV